VWCLSGISCARAHDIMGSEAKHKGGEIAGRQYRSPRDALRWGALINRTSTASPCGPVPVE